jgi:hypothetical protein
MEEHIKFYEPPRLTPTNRVQLHRVRENNETIEDVRKGYMEHARMIFMIKPENNNLENFSVQWMKIIQAYKWFVINESPLLHPRDKTKVVSQINTVKSAITQMSIFEKSTTSDKFLEFLNKEEPWRYVKEMAQYYFDSLLPGSKEYNIANQNRESIIHSHEVNMGYYFDHKVLPKMQSNKLSLPKKSSQVDLENVIDSVRGERADNKKKRKTDDSDNESSHETEDSENKKKKLGITSDVIGDYFAKITPNKETSKDTPTKKRRLTPNQLPSAPIKPASNQNERTSAFKKGVIDYMSPLLTPENKFDDKYNEALAEDISDEEESSDEDDGVSIDKSFISKSDEDNLEKCLRGKILLNEKDQQRAEELKFFSETKLGGCVNPRCFHRQECICKKYKTSSKHKKQKN